MNNSAYNWSFVGGPGGDPIAYTAEVQVLLIQSAASTVVLSGGGSGTVDNAAIATAVWASPLALTVLKFLGLK